LQRVQRTVSINLQGFHCVTFRLALCDGG
jgi:hypothetical protein